VTSPMGPASGEGGHQINDLLYRLITLDMTAGRPEIDSWGVRE
jgi:hypothetical protein